MHYSLAEEKMNEVIGHLNEQLSLIRTGRANTSLLDPVSVDYYGAMTPLNQIASLTVVEGTQIVVKPYDKGSLKDIEKAVHLADLGFNPINDGTVVRINIPALTEEVRKTVVKDVSKIGEDHKIMIRNIRRDANTAVNKDEEYTEDDQRNEQKRIQDLTNNFTDKIDELVKVKSDEVMTI